MKIYVVIIENKHTGNKWPGCDLTGQMCQEVFLTKEHAMAVFNDATPVKEGYAVSLHEFEV